MRELYRRVRGYLSGKEGPSQMELMASDFSEAISKLDCLNDRRQRFAWNVARSEGGALVGAVAAGYLASFKIADLYFTLQNVATTVVVPGQMVADHTSLNSLIGKCLVAGVILTAGAGVGGYVAFRAGKFYDNFRRRKLKREVVRTTPSIESRLDNNDEGDLFDQETHLDTLKGAGEYYGHTTQNFSRKVREQPYQGD